MSAPARVGRALARRWDAVLVVAVAFAFVAHLFATGDWFYGSGTDLPRMELPFHDFATRWLARGVLPFWNPFLFGGVPFQAGLHGYLYPGWWTGVVLPLGLDVKVGILLHLALAATGGVWLARPRVRHRAAAALAGITVALSAFPIQHLFAGHRVLVATAAWLPWIAGALDRVLREGPRRVPLAALFCGLAVLCGNYQVVFIGMGGILGFLLLEAALGEGAAGLGPRARARRVGAAAAAWTATLAGGTAVAAVQVLPVLGALARSQRAEGGLAFAGLHSTPPGLLLTYLFPQLFGNHLDLFYVAPGSLWEALGYVGVVPLALVAAAPLAIPWRRWLPAAAVIALAVVLSLGIHTPLFALYVETVPGAALFRVPGRFCLLVGLFGALLAAEVLDAWLAAAPRRARRIAWPAALLALAAAAFAAALHPGGGLARAVLSLADPARVAALPPAALRPLADGLRLAGPAALFLLATALALALGPGPLRRRRTAVSVLLLVHAVDLYAVSRPFLRTAPAARFDWPARVTDVVRGEDDPALRVIPPPTGTLYDSGMRHDVASPGGYDTFIEARAARYLNRAEGRPLGAYFDIARLRRGGPLVRHLGARLLLTDRPLGGGGAGQPGGYEGFALVARAGPLLVYRDPEPEPRAAVVHAAEVVPDELETYRLMEQPDFDVGRVALLEAPLPTGVRLAGPPAGAAESAHVLHYEPDRVVLEVEAAAPGLLVLSDLMAPGWTARVDGIPTPMQPANRVMRALPVQAGRHRVEMTFWPPGFRGGAVTSALAALALALAALRLRRGDRAAGEPGAPR